MAYTHRRADKELVQQVLLDDPEFLRNEKALVLALMEMYVEGISTRKVGEVTEELCGTSISKSFISELAGNLDSELEVCQRGPRPALSTQ